MNKKELTYLLKKYHIDPRKEQGQNFLIDQSVVDASVRAADLQPDDTVLEIGPGFGVLTLELAKHAKKVVAVEQDHKIFAALEKIAAQQANIQAVSQDIRTFHMEQAGLQHKEYKLVSNLPYSISSWVLRNFFEHHPSPSLAVLMVQKEVAEHVVAEPGQMSVLSVAVQCFAQASIVQLVPASSFYPAPEVDSAIIKLQLRQEPLSKDPKKLLSLVKTGFSSKRKQLHNNIHAGLQISQEQAAQALQQTGLKPTVRAQELTLEQWEQLREQIEAI